jgi:hypothetical protein
MILNNFLSDAALKEHPVCHSHPPQFDVAGWHKPGAELARLYNRVVIL